MPLFDNLVTRLSQVSLSDINHQLGKAKESLVYESGSYFQNFKSDASHVGSLMRSESTRFGSLVGGKERVPALPKSTSLPVMQNLTEEREECRPCRERVRLSKYRYRSTSTSQHTETQQNITSQEDSLVTRFIRVVGSEEQKKDKKDEIECGQGRSLSSREDIRKKLASFGEEDTICEEDEECENNNLEICFINEIASDDEEVMFNPLAEAPDDDTKDVVTDKKDVEALKSAAAVALGQCRETARRQLAMEKQKKLADDTLKKLIGVTSTELTRERMTSYNVNTLQVILNDIRDKIEYHNAELVTLLMEKDELENEQDSMLMDMEDIPHSALI